MINTPKKYSKEFKTKVALETIKGDKTVNQIASAYQINPSQVKRWKKKALDGLNSIFAGEGKGIEYDIEAKQTLIEELYKQIGQLKYENDWVKKKLGILS
jgi:transposase-like protein